MKARAGESDIKSSWPTWNLTLLKKTNDFVSPTKDCKNELGPPIGFSLPKEIPTTKGFFEISGIFLTRPKITQSCLLLLLLKIGEPSTLTAMSIEKPPP